MERAGKILNWLLGCMMFLGLHTFALAGSMTGELDKVEGQIEDQFIYTLAIQGSADGEPEFPKVEGLEVQKAGTSQSVSIINGRFSREVQYQFIITAQRAGSFTIPPIRLKIDGTPQETLSIDLTVKPESSPGGSAQNNAEQAVFVERELSKDKIYVGESIVSHVRIFHRVKLYGAEPKISYPPSFQVRSIDEQKNYNSMIAGEEYAVAELNAVLTPSQAGEFTIAPAELHAKIAMGRKRSRSLLDDWMSQTEVTTKRFRSPPSQLQVLPLPLEGRRSDFSGLVGEFSLDAAVSKDAVNLGETVTVTLTITGQGATTGMAEPELKLGDKVKIYRDKPQSLDQIDLNKGIVGKRILKFAVVPTQPGLIELGSLKLQYFDSAAGQYQDLVAKLGPVQVSGSSAVTESLPSTSPRSEAAPSKEVEKLGEDLVEPHTPSRLESNDHPSALDWATGGILSLASLMAFTGTFWRQKQSEQGADREARRRAKVALQQFRGQMQEARQLLDRDQSQAAMVLAQASLKSYLSDKFAIKTSHLSLNESLKCLSSRNVPEPVQEQLRELSSAFERLLFSAKPPSREAALGWLQKIESLMQEVDQRC